jgi:hypothetical protein
MKIALPISDSDKHLLEPLLDLLCHFGKLANHSFTLAPAFSQREAAQVAADRLRQVCDNVDVLDLEFEGDGSWPQSPNKHWALTMQAIHAKGNKEPVFWMELDCTPIDSNWADALDNEWRRGRKAHCGLVLPKPSVGPNKVLFYEADDLFLMGCSIYNPRMLDNPMLRPMFQNLLTGAHGEAWDFYLRGHLRKDGWHHTDLICDRWNTENYRYEGPKLVCDARKTDVTHQDYKNADCSKAVLIHGCKDSSLARLILSGEKPSELPMAEHAPIHIQTGKPTQAQQFFPPVSFPKFEEAIAEMRAASAEMKESTALLNRIISEFQQAQQPAPEPEAIAVGPNAADTAALEPATLRGILADGKAQQVAILAKELNVDKKALEAMIKTDAHLHLRHGWVSLLAA